MIEGSKWSYETAGSGGVGIGELLISGGKFVLKAPDGKLHLYRYAGIGAGVGLNIRLPKSLRLPDIRLPRGGHTVSGGGATTDFQAGGSIWRFYPTELKPGDFAGMTIYIDTSFGLLVSESLSGFIVGIDPRGMIPWMFNPGLFASALGASAKGFVVLRGMGEGLIDGGSAGCMLGSITYSGVYSEDDDQAN